MRDEVSHLANQFRRRSSKILNATKKIYPHRQKAKTESGI